MIIKFPIRFSKDFRPVSYKTIRGMHAETSGNLYRILTPRNDFPAKLESERRAGFSGLKTPTATSITLFGVNPVDKAYGARNGLIDRILPNGFPSDPIRFENPFIPTFYKGSVSLSPYIK